MIKFKFTGRDGKAGIGFGLSAENVKRLQAGQPIAIDLTEMGIEADVMIFYGETEVDMYNDLKEFIGKDTKVHGV